VLGTLIKEYIIPKNISDKHGEPKVLSVDASYPRYKKFYLNEEVGLNESIMYRVYDEQPKFEPLTEEEIIDHVSGLVIFVRNGNELNLVPRKILLMADMDVSIFESKRVGYKHFLHDDQLGVYYPLDVRVKHVLYVPRLSLHI
jgi:hypothetical protein